MKLYRPVSTNNVTQWFGEDKTCRTTDKPRKYISKETEETCPAGYESLYKEVGMKGHNGIDFGLSYMQPVYHSADWDGWIKTETDKHGGVGVEVISNEKIDGSYWKLKYWHLDHRYPNGVHDGAECWTGKLIGYADSTGQSTGDHLHWGLKRCDKEGNALNKGNGHYGAVDPEPYFINEFIGEDYKLTDEDIKVFNVLSEYGLVKTYRFYLAYQRSKWSIKNN